MLVVNEFGRYTVPDPKAQKLSRSKSIVGSGPVTAPLLSKGIIWKIHKPCICKLCSFQRLSSLISFLTNDDEKTFKVEETLKLLEIHRRIYSLYLSWENTKKDEGHSRILLFPSAFQKWLNHFQVHRGLDEILKIRIIQLTCKCNWFLHASWIEVKLILKL